MSTHCSECNRARRSCAARVAEAGAGCRRSSRACRSRPAPGMTRRSFLRARLGRALARLRRREARARAVSTTGSRGRRGAAAAADARVDLPRRAAPTRCRCSHPAAIRPTTSCARSSRSRRAAGCLHRGRRGSCGTRPRAGLATLHGEGKVTVMPAIGYTHPNQSHFTWRHYWEVGATRRDAADRLARPLPRRRRHARQPAPGPLARLHTRARARDREDPVAADRSAAPTTTSGPTASGRPGQRPDARVVRRARASRRRPRPRSASRRRPATRSTSASSCCRSRRRRQARFTSPVTYPTTGDPFPHQLAGARGDDRRRAADHMRRAGRRRARTTPTPTRPQRSRTDLSRPSTSLLAFQRDLEARGLADRVLVTLWSEFGRRAQENGSGTDHGAAGALPDRHAGDGQDGRRVPRPRDGSTSTATWSDTSDFRGDVLLAARAVAPDRRRLVIPGASAFTRPTLTK